MNSRSALAAQLAAALTACLLTGCTAAEPTGDELGAPLPTPALALQAEGGTRVPNAVLWSVAVPEAFRSAAGVFALGEYFVLTALEGPAPGIAGITAKLLVGQTDDGRQLGVREVPGTIAQPFIFTESGRPMALVNTQASPEAPVQLNKIDLLSGQTRWRIPAALASDAGSEVQFRAVAKYHSTVIGQVVARRERKSRCGVCAVALADGKVVWTIAGKVPAAGTATLSTVVDHGMVGTEFGDLKSSTAHLFDAGSGRRLAQLASSWTADLMSPPIALTRDGMVVQERPDDLGIRDAVAVDREGRRRWRVPIRRERVMAAGDGLVVLPLSDGGYRASTVLADEAVWTIPAAHAAQERFTFRATMGDRLLGGTATTSVVLRAQTGKPIYSEWFDPINPAQWDGRHFLGWSPERELTAYHGRQSPVGVEFEDGGEVPVFVDG